MTDTGRWSKVDEILDGALARPSEERARWLDEACGEDSQLKAEVQRLLDLALLEDDALRGGAGVDSRLAAEAVRDLGGESDSRMLAQGERVGPYQIQELLGSGGMGRVYRARDLNLERDVAIKALTAELEDNPAHLRRFRREAKLLATLNHPNIASVYDLQIVGAKPYIILELVEGPTLAERLTRGPIPLDEALTLGLHIAEALEEAHSKNIIHRDLKPGNVKLLSNGRVKLLDFGVGKLLAGDVEESPGEPRPSSSPDSITEAGAVVGTLRYMAPEQLEGKPVDNRTDIFAFGTLLFEMVTGRKAFDAKGQPALIAAILAGEPTWERLPEDSPPLLESLLRRCLRKDPSRRVHHIADARIEIEECLDADTPAVGRRPKKSLRALAAGVALAASLVTGAAVWRFKPEPAAPVQRFSLTLPSNQGLPQLRAGSHVSLSPDGKRLAYVADRQLYVRSMDQLEATSLRGTENAGTVFFSPDGQSLGFYANGRLQRISLAGGSPVDICRALRPFGVSWGDEGTIVFGQGRDGIFRVSADGGSPEVLVRMDATRREIGRKPQLLPGGRHVLMTVGTETNPDAEELVVQSLDDGERRVLVTGAGDGLYVPTGHLAYVRNGTLFVVPFDLGRLEVSGEPLPIVEGLTPPSRGTVDFSFSRDGTLVYVPDNHRDSRLVWVDRSGNTSPVAETRLAFARPRLSPDGARLAVSISDELGTQDIWIHDSSRDALSRFTFEGRNISPIWSPDGGRLVFASTRNGAVWNLYRKSVDASAAAEPLALDRYRIPTAISPDGTQLVFRQQSDDNDWDIGVVPLDGPGEPEILLGTSFNELPGALSPDGKWLAYESDESGRREVYVQRFPSLGSKTQISTSGGTEPLWAPDGRELFYRNGDEMMAVAISTEPELSAERPTSLFTGAFQVDDAGIATNYDVAPRGERFLMIESGETSRTITVNIVLNWFRS